MFNLNLEKTKSLSIIFGFILLVFIVAAVLFTILRPKQPVISGDEFVKTLPFITKEFAVVYSKDKNSIYINVYNPPFDQNRQKAIDWLKSQNVDLKKFKIIY